MINQVLFRFGDDTTTNAMLAHVQQSGEAWMGGTTWDERAAIRLSVSSWRTTESDIDRTVAAFETARVTVSPLPMETRGRVVHHESEVGTWELVLRPPDARLRRYVGDYQGYTESGTRRAAPTAGPDDAAPVDREPRLDVGDRRSARGGKRGAR